MVVVSVPDIRILKRVKLDCQCTDLLMSGRIEHSKRISSSALILALTDHHKYHPVSPKCRTRRFDGEAERCAEGNRRSVRIAVTLLQWDFSCIKRHAGCGQVI
ncbi:hypothetical protein Mapa_009108 [Marchantia paleacea]|nr:hypothetical protein Mapa_009108 [Marchantia paleacea]